MWWWGSHPIDEASRAPDALPFKRRGPIAAREPQLYLLIGLRVTTGSRSDIKYISGLAEYFLYVQY